MIKIGVGGYPKMSIELHPREDGKRVVRSVNACLVPVLSCDEWEITTVEGIGSRRTGLSDVQSRQGGNSMKSLKTAQVCNKGR